MSIVVAYKYAANPQEASVDSSGKVDWSRAKLSVSEYDPVAIQVARDLADEIGEAVVGISVGTEAVASSMAKKNALSRGLDKAVVLADDSTMDWNATKVASALAELVKRVGDASIVMTGDSSVDEGAKLMSALVAGFLGWPCLQEVTSVTKTNDGYELAQVFSGGVRTISVQGAVVVALTSDAAELKAASMKDILAAGKKELEVIPLSDVSLADSAIELSNSAMPEQKSRKNELFTGDDAVDKLIGALRQEGLA